MFSMTKEKKREIEEAVSIAENLPFFFSEEFTGNDIGAVNTLIEYAKESLEDFIGDPLTLKQAMAMNERPIWFVPYKENQGYFSEGWYLVMIQNTRVYYVNTSKNRPQFTDGLAYSHRKDD